MKTYLRHNCDKQHKSAHTFVRCIWPFIPAHQVWGEGEYASVTKCPRGWTVELHNTAEEAEAAKRIIDVSGCGGLCAGRHELIRFVKP